MCDPMWHVSTRSGVATLQLLYTCYLLTYLPRPDTPRRSYVVHRRIGRSAAIGARNIGNQWHL